MQETWVQYLSWEDPLEEGMATHFSILAWRSPIDRGAWGATVHGIARSRARLSDQAQYTYITTHPQIQAMLQQYVNCELPSQKTLGGTFLVWKEWKRGASVTTDLARASLLQGFLSSKVCFPRLCKLSFYVFKCAACWLWGEWFPESSGFPILGKVIRVTWNVCKTWKSRRPHRGSWLDNVLYCDSIAHSTSGPFFTFFFFFF